MGLLRNYFKTNLIAIQIVVVHLYPPLFLLRNNCNNNPSRKLLVNCCRKNVFGVIFENLCDEILTLCNVTIYFQTQSCNWRNPKNKSVRKRRDLIDEEEDASKTFNETLSESVSLFQAIHVLQTDEDELTFQNETNAGTVTFF